MIKENANTNYSLSQKTRESGFFTFYFCEYIYLIALKNFTRGVEKRFDDFN